MMYQDMRSIIAKLQPRWYTFFEAFPIARCMNISSLTSVLVQ
jgi:hypothetical protein